MSNISFRTTQNPLRRRSWRYALIAMGLAAGLAPATAATGPSGAEEIAIWPGTAPGSQGASAKQEVVERSKDPAVKDRAVFGVTRPTLEVWKPQTPNGTAVIVMPGGAYQRVVVDKEGMEMGDRATKDGVTVFVLTLPASVGGHAQAADVALQDAQRAVRLRAQERTRVGPDAGPHWSHGFSAGGHVAASLGTSFDKKVYDAVDADTVSAKPDFLALILSCHLDGSGCHSRGVTPQSPGDRAE